MDYQTKNRVSDWGCFV